MKIFKILSHRTGTGIISLFLAALLVSITSCGAGKYGDIKEFYNDIISTQEKYTAAIPKIDSSDDLIKLISSLGDDVVSLSKRERELGKKYPGIDILDNPPAELQAHSIKAKTALINLVGVFSSNDSRLGKFASDPQVLVAVMGLITKMQQIAK